MVLFLPFAVAAAPIGPSVSVPAADAVVLQMDDAGLVASAQPALSAEDLAYQIRRHIERSRATGSPRPLGLAQGMLARLPQQQWTADVYLMRATVLQRLHRFDEAEADLSRVLQEQPDNAQAWLTRYSIALVRDDLDTAKRACQQLAQYRPGLLAESCRQEVASYGEQPEQAVSSLRQALKDASGARAIERDYALVTLADMASRLQLPEAGSYWQRSLLLDPDDLYRRARYADWLLGQGEPAEVVELTQGYEHVDTLAVLRAIALKRTGHLETTALSEDLEQRFDEARWRGEFLHQWEYARFMLDVKDDPDVAFLAARENWKTQRGAPDRELLIRAAAAAGQSPGVDVSTDEEGML
jgi:tetratricopeptide (TPR) repeat protein